ncbi:MAG: PDZ domain-containing protein [Planctomycetota bacterium]|nr:PDZ domain-containing protein [Planctomycetota bacterium]
MLGRPAQVIAVLALCLSGAAAGAIPPVLLNPRALPSSASEGDRSDEWLAERVAALDADDLSTRDTAARDIIVEADLPLIERALARADLSPEQRTRLDALAFSRFRMEPRGAMGVSFSGFSSPQGVELSATVAGFDAARELRAGDIIRAMDGLPVRVTNDARAIILSHDPGDEVTVEIARQGEVRAVTLRLGRFVDLQNAASPDDDTLAAAWAIRAARRAPPAPEVLDTGMTPERFAAISRRADRAPVAVQPPAARLAPGGAGRPVSHAEQEFLIPRSGTGDPELDALRAQILQLDNNVRQRDRALTNERNPARREALLRVLMNERATLNAMRAKLDELARQRRKIVR